ncbi:MAG: S26 family signal peptidase [Spirochaeta sp.]|jgi:hypothetical protein|nr:S26 family signal peptidase [Spirochaeta sp.]
MTDRFRRQQNRRRRRLVFLVGVVVFFVVRLVGPGTAIVRTTSLEPMLQSGDVVRVTRPGSQLDRGDTVSWRPPGGTRRFGPFQMIRSPLSNAPEDKNAITGQPRSVPRIVAATADDQVSWDDRNVTVRSDGEVRRYALPPLHARLVSPVRQVRLQPGEIFVVALQPGRIDSRVIGPVDADTVLFRITRIMWPANRRAAVNGTVYLENPR